MGPGLSFADLAAAVDQAFARWDLPISMCSDCRTTGFSEKRARSGIRKCWTKTSFKVSSTVGIGDRFDYVFDLGDEWRHSCEVEAMDVDPIDAYGIVPRAPVPIWGWGWIPDQYGRRSPEDDGDEKWQLRWVKTSDGTVDEP